MAASHKTAAPKPDADDKSDPKSADEDQTEHRPAAHHPAKPKKLATPAAVVRAEAPGHPTVWNPSVEDGGLGRFTDAVWLRVLRLHHPDIAEGRSDSDLLAMKTGSPTADLQREMVDDYAHDNAERLDALGAKVDEISLGLAHFLGPDAAAAIVKADPGTAMSSLVPPAAIQQNPWLANQTAGDLIEREKALIDASDEKLSPEEAMKAWVRAEIDLAARGHSHQTRLHLNP